MEVGGRGETVLQGKEKGREMLVGKDMGVSKRARYHTCDIIFFTPVKKKIVIFLEKPNVSHH